MVIEQPQRIPYCKGIEFLEYEWMALGARNLTQIEFFRVVMDGISVSCGQNEESGVLMRLNAMGRTTLY